MKADDFQPNGMQQLTKNQPPHSNPKKCPAVHRELDMVLTGFVVADSLKKVGKNIFGQLPDTV